MKKVALVLSAATLLLASTTAFAGQREDVAKRWAPVLQQEIKDGKDLFTAYDFDGNWAGDDNDENLKSCLDGTTTCDLAAKVYFTVIETSTHWFVNYLPYHATDAKMTNGHEHDTESVLVVVAKDGSPTGKLLAVEMRFHLDWFVYADAAIVKDGAKKIDGAIHADGAGHPQVYVQQVGHGFCGGFSPPNNVFPDLQLQCKHAEQPHIDGTGVIYSPDLPATAPKITKDQTVTVGYALEEILTSFWARRTEVGEGKTFKTLIDFAGERCNVLACPKQFGGAFQGNRGSSPSGPWDQEAGDGTKGNGSQFFDPAFTMSKRLTFAPGFSVDYCHNPYLGIVDQCAKPQSTDPTAPGDPTKPSTETKPSDPATTDPAIDDDPSLRLTSEEGCSTTRARADLSSAVLAVIAAVVALRRRRRQ